MVRLEEELEAEGVGVVDDSFAGTDFAALAELKDGYDLCGSESLAFDLEPYLQRLGPAAPAHTLKELVALTGVDPFAEGQALESVNNNLPGLQASLANPSSDVCGARPIFSGTPSTKSRRPGVASFPSLSPSPIRNRKSKETGTNPTMGC